MTPKDIKIIRVTNDWTQKDLADRLGISVRTIAGMETGEKPIDRRTELAIKYLAQ